jgi:hypothetical protein
MAECPLGFSLAAPKSKCPFFANIIYVILFVVLIGILFHLHDLEDDVSELQYRNKGFKGAFQYFQKRFGCVQTQLDHLSDKLRRLTSLPEIPDLDSDSDSEEDHEEDQEQEDSPEPIKDEKSKD